MTLPNCANCIHYNVCEFKMDDDTIEKNKQLFNESELGRSPLRYSIGCVEFLLNNTETKKEELQEAMLSCCCK